MQDSIANHYGSKTGMLDFWRYRFLFLLFPRQFSFSSNNKIQRLIFICQGNVCRSAAAQIIAQELGFPSDSFGLDTDLDLPAHEKMVAAARKDGYALEAHRSKPINNYSPKAGDLLLVMEPWHHKALKELPGIQDVPVSYLGIYASSASPYLHDPYNCNETFFLNCFRRINEATKSLIKQLQSP